MIWLGRSSSVVQPIIDLLGQNILVLIKVATEKVLYNIYFTLAMSLYDLKLQNLHKVEFSMEKF